MTRRQRSGRRAALEQAPRSRIGGLFVGLVIGLVIGLVVAAGIAWYLTSKPSPFKTIEQAPVIPPTVPEAATQAPGSVVPRPPASATTGAESDVAATAPAPTPPRAEMPAPANQVSPKPGRETPTKSDFTFFDILPGEQTGQPPRQKAEREVWWLQVAALREAKAADQLKVRLSLLGLPVQTQQVVSGEATLHRVRVGPFKTEDEALGALDILSENDYEPRLFKEQLNPP